MRGDRTIAGRFELIERAGAGGMSTVYRGRDRETGREVAVKLLRPRDVLDRERFAREAAVLAELRHPGIVRYIAHGAGGDSDDGDDSDGDGDGDGDDAYLVMEWLAHETLAARLAAGGLTLAKSVAVVRQVAIALGAAHASGVVHRDVKPENLLLVGPEAVKVADFGIARPIVATEALTRTGVTVGTPSYMSPEQARGDREIDGRSDVFALGCVFYECVTGRVCFDGQNPLAAMVKVLHAEPAPVAALRAETPATVIALVDRMLAKTAARRPRTMDDVVAAIDAIGPISDDAQRPALDPAAAQETAVHGPQCVVLVAARRGAAEAPVARRAEVETLAQGAHVDTLLDGSLVVVMPARDSPAQRAMRAVRVALAVRRGLGDVLVAVGTVDGAATALGAAVLAAVFARLQARGARSDGVRVDAPTGALLGTAFEIAEAPDGLVVIGERAG